MESKQKYLVMARAMRPQTFKEVVGQEKIKSTLHNALLMDRVGHAYLFCGSHGIGKTTLARLFAKVLNCDQPSDGEPCNQCSSCRDITKASSLDVIEIDGASNRGIDDIRQINESVGFATKAGKHKIYIIDEVHMLTKEAFNALLKTLEAPPPFVKFLFATTESHKILPTILSRCQCFYLQPLTHQEVALHIINCAQREQVTIPEECAELIAERAGGSLRDALVLTDQLISYCDSEITTQKVFDFLGLCPLSKLFEFDIEAKSGNLQAALKLAHSLFSSGNNLMHFLDFLCKHFRQILYIKVFKGNPNCLQVNAVNWPHYEKSAQCYSYEQCLHIVDLILKAQGSLKKAISKQVAVESLLVQIVRSHQRVSVSTLINQLESLKSNLNFQEVQGKKAPTAQSPVLKNIEKATPKVQPSVKENIETAPPKAQIHVKENIEKTPPKASPPPSSPKKVLPKAQPVKPSPKNTNICYDTLMQFAAVELEGSLKKKG